MLLLRIAFISWMESRNMQYNFIVMFKIHFTEYQYQKVKTKNGTGFKTYDQEY